MGARRKGPGLGPAPHRPWPRPGRTRRPEVCWGMSCARATWGTAIKSEESWKNGRKPAGTGPAGGSTMVGYHRSEEHTSELQSLMRISYAVFCLKKNKTTNNKDTQK